eukprot:COSAG02_NODE_2147_length_9663_cov_8.071936_4_plen_126_part_00
MSNGPRDRAYHYLKVTEDAKCHVTTAHDACAQWTLPLIRAVILHHSLTLKPLLGQSSRDTVYCAHTLMLSSVPMQVSKLSTCLWACHQLAVRCARSAARPWRPAESRTTKTVRSFSPAATAAPSP